MHALQEDLDAHWVDNRLALVLSYVSLFFRFRSPFHVWRVAAHVLGFLLHLSEHLAIAA